LLQGSRGSDRSAGQQQGDPCCNYAFTHHLGPPAQSVDLRLGALVGRGQYPRLNPQGKTHAAAPAAGPMQGFGWAWQKRGHGGALWTLTLLSHEFDQKSPNADVLNAMGQLSFQFRTDRVVAQ
jgi:hypothetical protein